MRRTTKAIVPAGVLLLLVFQAGCGLFPISGPGQQVVRTSPLSQPSKSAQPAETSIAPGRTEIQQTTFSQVATLMPPGDVPLPVDPPAGPSAELTVDAVVRDVLARNPSLTQMIAAWQAVKARFPQVTSLDDPMFGAQVAPGAFGSNQVNGGYRLEVAQKFPFCGKLELRGENALAEARAVGNEVEDMRLQLAEAARNAFYDYYLVGRALAVNREGLKLLAEFKGNAETRYKTGLVPQQDILQAEVEIGEQRQRQVTLERMREVAVARINTLRHLPPDTPLAPPPEKVGSVELPPDVLTLREAALARRPDLQALANRIAAEQAALSLAKKEYGPDVEVMAAYDSLWQERQLRAQVGVRLNLPVRLEKRLGAITEAEARIAQRQAELARLADQVNLQVQEAVAQVRESERIVKLFEAEVLRAARENVKAAQPAYVTGKIPFLTLVEAQRKLVTLQDRYYEAIADYFRRQATLERVIGGPLRD